MNDDIKRAYMLSLIIMSGLSLICIGFMALHFKNVHDIENCYVITFSPSFPGALFLGGYLIIALHYYLSKIFKGNNIEQSDND